MSTAPSSPFPHDAHYHLAEAIMQRFPRAWRCTLAEIVAQTLLNAAPHWQPHDRQEDALATMLVATGVLEAVQGKQGYYQISQHGMQSLGAILVATLLEPHEE